MFRIKICGITSVEDALVVAGAGADAIGLNFYARSPRCVGPETARQIAAAVPQTIIKVGLFVNAAVADVCRTFDALGLDLVQLHGDEPPEYLPQLGERPVLKAFRLGDAGLRPVNEFLARCQALRNVPRLVLLDAAAPGKYGGTGRTADWSVAAEYATLSDTPPLVLAGGLTPVNVAEAIRMVRPAAVDTASGVESSPGHKDPVKVEAFVRAAKSRG
jgi:phosphoribosylanthranilate isomerase